MGVRGLAPDCDRSNSVSFPPLTRDPSEEDPVADEIAAPQPPGFLHQAKQPFETSRLHPNGGTADALGCKIEKSPDREREATTRGRQISRNPDFLGRIAECYQQKIGA